MINRNVVASILLLCSFSVLLTFFRVILSFGSDFYLFLNWNLFLGFLPFVFTYIFHKTHKNNFKVVNILLFLATLFFWPNAPYLITDILHLPEVNNAPIWYDYTLLFLFAFVGVILAFVSLHYWQEYVRKWKGRSISWSFVAIFIFLSSYGVYLGRYLRFNTWDIVNNPIGLFSYIGTSFTSLQMWGFTLLFFSVLFIIYLSLYLLTRKD